MSYFRSEALLIGKLIKTDSLRYTAKNTAVLTTVFSTSVKNEEHFILVRIVGDMAESLSRQQSLGGWFEVKGQLMDFSPELDSLAFPKISIQSNHVIPLPGASNGLVACEIIGRLTKPPEKIVKTNDFEFARFTLAVNRQDVEKASYFNISVFKPKLIQQTFDCLDKGLLVYAAGTLAFYKAGEKQTLSYSIKLEKFIELK